MRGMQSGRMPAWMIGLVMTLVIAVASYFAYTKDLPWGGGDRVTALFASAQNLRTSNPVRVAGVNVGEVVEVDALADGDATQGVVVTMELNDEAPTLHEDAQFKIRPRLFLEGNYFIDLHPGTPNAPTVSDGHDFPVNQTAYSPQIDQLFSTFQADVRSSLQTLLDQFGNALTRYGGAEGFRELNRVSPRAYRYTAEVNEAFLGREPGDLSGTIRGLGDVLRGLGRDEQALQGFVTNLEQTTGAFAAEEQALARSIELLPGFLEAGEPAFVELNRSLPALRAFAREILPGVESTPETLRVATPFFAQMRQLMSPAELGGLARDLKPTVPLLGRLNRANLGFLEQQRYLSSCFNEVIIPWSNSTVEPIDPTGTYTHMPEGRVFEESAYGLTGTAGESRSGDANGQHLRVMGGSGAFLVRLPSGPTNSYPTDAFGLVPYEILGAMPAISDSVKTPFEPDVPCETQEPPNLQAGIGGPPPDQVPIPTSAQPSLDALEGPGAERLRRSFETLGSFEQLAPTLDPGEDSAAQILERVDRALGDLGLGYDARDLLGLLGGEGS